MAVVLDRGEESEQVEPEDPTEAQDRMRREKYK